ncbi:type VI secretion system-associated FHA domain protein TagH [Bradyrhizobium sp. CNPSo 4026]|nr:type VI secretion system-associated FHA domain protein TagH [Bradyrhizobium cenepequi]
MGRNAQKAFGPEGGALGRGASCQWQLPDPTNTLSARHALIAFNGIGFTITDTSTNGVYINTVDTPLGRGNAAPLTDGDTLYMASYIISVMIENDPVEKHQRLGLTGSNAVPVGRVAPAESSPSLAQELPDALIRTAGPLGSDTNLQLDPLRAVGGRQSSSHSPAQERPQAVVPPQTRDPLLEDETRGKDLGSAEPNLLTGFPRTAQLSNATKAQAPSSHALLGKMPSTPVPSVEPPFVEPSHRPPLALNDGGGGPSNGHPAPIIPEDLDLDDLLPGAALRGAPPAPPQRANPSLGAPSAALQVARKPRAPALANDFGPLRALGESAPPLGERELNRLAVLKQQDAQPVVGTPELDDAAPIAAPLSPAASPLNPDELQEFWSALGLDPDLVPLARRRDVFAELGRALAEMAHGLHSILAAWAMAKKEFQIEPRRIRAGNNNVFKFMKSGHGALREALEKHHGFLPLSRSVREGFDDIKAHEVAAIAAMRNAVSNVLTHMSPQRIESDGANSGLFGAHIRKAKLWDRFVELHASMVNDIDQTARSYIAEEFARSYESQLSVLGQAEKKTK